MSSYAFLAKRVKTDPSGRHYKFFPRNILAQLRGGVMFNETVFLFSCFFKKIDYLQAFLVVNLSVVFSPNS